MGIKLNAKIVFILLISSALLHSQNLSKAYLSYIDQYQQLAVKQQKEYGIPASITLAQGLLESSAGVSAFARESNNHFGIKCTDWTGETIYHDDDEKGECFRKYNQVLESYEDHSLFLKNRKRYAFLFDLKPTDYEGWAFGLKKAGYATDPTYAYKLISIIENYGLHKLDFDQSYPLQTSVGIKVATQERKTTAIGVVNAVVVHEVKKVNKIKFVTSVNGDSYSSIADEFDISTERLLAFNDLGVGAVLNPGTRVFIASKKNKAPKECLTHQVFEGESMLSISQDYGIKVVKLYKLNDLAFTDAVKVGQVLKLR